MAFSSIQLEHLNCSESDIMAQWVVLKHQHMKDIVIANMYQPPKGNIDNFIDYLTTSMDKLGIRPNCDFFSDG